MGHQEGVGQAVEAACEAELGALFDLMARCHGITDPQTLGAARGAFCGLVYLIREAGSTCAAASPSFLQARSQRPG